MPPSLPLVLLAVLACTAAAASGGPTVPNPSAARRRGGHGRAAAAARAEAAATIVAPAAPASAATAPAVAARGGGDASAVATFEFLKFGSLSLMMFFVVCVFTFTRDAKDTLVVTTCGAEAIVFLKVYCVIPAAMAFTVWYSALAQRLSRGALFHATLVPFFAFFALFGWVVYPMRDALHLPEAALGGLVARHGGLKYPVSILRHWTYALYYVVAELWGSAGVPLVFWTFANDVTSFAQAKKWYPLLGLVGNLGPVASGFATRLIADRCGAGLADPELAFERQLKLLTGVMLACGGVIAALHKAVSVFHRRECLAGGAPPPDPHALGAAPKKSGKAKKPSLRDGLALLSESKYLACIAAMVLSYGLAIEFTEVLWKSALKHAYPDKSDYIAFMGRYSQRIGLLTFCMMFVGSGIVKTFGWTAGAATTPLVMASLAVPFFACTFTDVTATRESLLRMVHIGTLQNMLSKSTKYAVFDPTKEMAFVNMDDHDLKVRGKAAIDVVCARLGKAGGALVQQGLVLAGFTILETGPVLAGAFSMAIVMWLTAVVRLGKLVPQ